MSRRAARRPPVLEGPAEHGPRAEREPTPRAQLVRARVAGRHERLGRVEVHALMRRIVAGERSALLGLARFSDASVSELEGVARAGWGWDPSEAVVTIDPDRTLDQAAVARARVVDVARRGGRVAFATSRPASLLPLHQALARVARDEGGTVCDPGEAGPFRAAGRARAQLWWLDGVAVLTDGAALLADPGLEAVDELLFELGYPDLLVGDGGYAGGAIAAGIEVVAFADVDALALGAAAERGAPVTLVPLQERRPPGAYRPLVSAFDRCPALAPYPARSAKTP